jgi:hypothetical protein
LIPETYYDPYDLWAIERIGRWKLSAQRGALSAIPIVAGIAFADGVAPTFMRRAMGVVRRSYAHTEALLSGASPEDQSAAQRFLAVAKAQLIRTNSGGGWGYPFDWYSRNAPNGVYAAMTLPFVTVTPYVMEESVRLRQQSRFRNDCEALFALTWGFLEDLVPLQDDDEGLCVSYAPVREPMKIVNASSYAAVAYALHAVHGSKDHGSRANERAHRLIRWVAGQQAENGSFPYLAGEHRLNFIDTFHSCIVVRNLRRAAELVPELQGDVASVAARGFAYIRKVLFDPDTGLCRRFARASWKDPLYRWDLYDQAEFLGLLTDFGCLKEARALVQRVDDTFGGRTGYAARITIFGRRWGVGYMRWGIAPYLYQKSRFERLAGA